MRITPAQIAQICHEANRAYQLATGDPVVSDHWEACTEETRQSAVAGVKVLVEDPSTTPEQLHLEWCEYKYNSGWVYGPVKDAAADPPTHPCLVSYQDLPIEQRMKDNLFRAIVLTFVQ